MTFYDRYNKTSKHLLCLALLPQSPYLFKYTCGLLSKGIMKASLKPVDEHLTSWPWFKAGVAILKQPLFDENAATSPDDFNVSEWGVTQMTAGFKSLVKSLRWYIQRLDMESNRSVDEEGVPVYPIEMEFDSAAAILESIIYQIDGGDVAPTGYHIMAHPVENLIFYDNKEIGIKEFRPWSLNSLYDKCDSKLDLHKLPWGTLLDQRQTFEQWYASYFDDPSAGVDDFEAYLNMLESHLPDVSEDRWFVGYGNADQKKSVPPPPPANPKNEAVGMRFEIAENTPTGCTTYKDTIMGKEYVISNRTRAKKAIDSLMIDDLVKGVKQWHDSWKNVKSAFVRDPAAEFSHDQVVHEAKPNLLGEKTDQFTGKWRIRTDAEMAELIKK